MDWINPSRFEELAPSRMTDAERKDPRIVADCANTIIDGAGAELCALGKEQRDALDPATRKRMEAVLQAINMNPEL